jgi:Zn ribbon nucleic-acid-binding protein
MFHQLLSRDECVECVMCGQAWDDSLTVAVEPEDFDCSPSAAKCAGSDVSDPDSDHAHYWDANGRGGAECVVCGFDIDLGGE